MEFELSVFKLAKLGSNQGKWDLVRVSGEFELPVSEFELLGFYCIS